MRVSTGLNRLGTLWPVVVVICVLWAFRSYGTRLPNVAANVSLWATWLLLTWLLLIRSWSAGRVRFPNGHLLARSATGASLLVALSSRVMTQTGNIPAAYVALLVAASLVVLMSTGMLFIAGNASAFAKSGDPQAVSRYLDVFLPIGLGSVLVREGRIITYAFWPGRRNADRLRTSSAVFSNHFIARPVLIALFCIALVELAIGHLLVRLLPTWIVTTHLIVSALFVFYVVGLIRSFASLPTVIQDGVLWMRMTVLFDAVTTVDNVRAVSRVHAMPADRDVANGAIIVAPNVLVELSRAIVVNRMFKPSRRAGAVALYVDDPTAFITTLMPRGARVVDGPSLDLAINGQRTP